MNKVRLKDVCEAMASNIAQKDISVGNGDYPIYGASGFIGNVDFYKQEKPYIGIVKDGAGVGRAYLLPEKSSVIGTMQYILPKDNIDIKYLYYAIQYMHLEKYYSGATIPHIYFRDYQYEPILLPGKKEQEKKTNVLEKIDKLVFKHKKTLRIIDTLVKSRFVEMFGDPHHSSLYPYRKVNDFTEVRSGGTPSRKQDSYWKDGTIRWVKTTELQNCEIYDTEEKITLEALENSSAKIVPAGTILIAMYGQGKTRGMTGYLKVESTTNQACACILPSTAVNQKYLWRYFMMSYEQLRTLAQGAGQPNLTGDMIKNFPVLIPPLELQEKYVAFAEQADKSKLSIQQSIETLQTLKAKLMQDYFG